MKISKALIEDWNFFLDRDDCSTFFHTPDWYNVWASYSGGTPHSLLLEFNNGQKGILPLLKKRGRINLLKNFLSSPGGTYGSIVTEEVLRKEALNEYRKFIHQLSGRVFGNPFKQELHEKEGRSIRTQVVHLEQGKERNFQNWSKGHKSAAKRAEREGVEINIGTTDADWDAYYDLYEKSLRRWGDLATSSYPPTFFHLIRSLNRDKVKLWLANYQGEVISGCLCFYHNRHVVYWHGAGNATYFKLGAVHYLQRVIIADACNRDLVWYDFNPSGGHEGVEKFKRGFGTGYIEFNEIMSYSLLNKFRSIFL